MTAAKKRPSKSAPVGRPRLHQKRVNIGLGAKVFAELEALAAADRRSVSSAAAILIEEALRARGRLK